MTWLAISLGNTVNHYSENNDGQPRFQPFADIQGLNTDQDVLTQTTGALLD